MGRELKRVALDFDWPLGEIWKGYINPIRVPQCPHCDGMGYSPQAKRYGDEWYGNAPFDAEAYGAEIFTKDHPAIQAFAQRSVGRSPEFYGVGDGAVQREARRLFDMWSQQWSCNLIQADVDALLAAGRLWDFTRTPRTEAQREVVRKKIADGGNSWLPEDNGHTPTAAEVNAWAMTPGHFGHDGINQGVCVSARCERMGVPDTCAKCQGDGEAWSDLDLKQKHDDWESYEPPNGEGFQLWGTTTEGEPQSPVFETLDLLCAWCEQGATTFGSNKVSAARWRKMLEDECVVHVEGRNLFF